MAAGSLPDDALDRLFRQARSHSVWLDKPVDDETLRQLYDLMKFGPTSMNGSPARILFLRTAEAKKRLIAALSAGNVEKTVTAPVTAIIGYDVCFFENLPRLFPHNANYKEMFKKSPELAETTAFRNATLQGAYFMLAARALGLDCGPMSGFDNKKVDAEFFGADKDDCQGCDQEFFPASHVKADFLCNLGYGDASRLYPRLPRLDFDEACVLL